MHLGTLVRTEARLFVEMFRLRIGLIIQVLASELARSRQTNIDEASHALLALPPYELKHMLSALLQGRLLDGLLGLTIAEHCQYISGCNLLQSRRAQIPTTRGKHAKVCAPDWRQ